MKNQTHDYRTVLSTRPLLLDMFQGIQEAQFGSGENSAPATPPPQDPHEASDQLGGPVDVDELQAHFDAAGVKHVTAKEYLLQRKVQGKPTAPLPRQFLPAAVKVALVFSTLLDNAGLTRKTVRVTSGYRPAAYNAAVGGKAKSDHIVGAAIDASYGGGFESAYSVATDMWERREINGLGKYCKNGYIHVGILSPYTKGHRRWFNSYCPEEQGGDKGED